MRAVAKLDLAEIQGNILYGYRSLPFGRFMYFRFRSADSGRAFLDALLPCVTTARHHQMGSTEGAKLPHAINIALSFAGLGALGLPRESLASFPAAFQAGMKARATELGDVEHSAPDQWDAPWGAGVPLLVMVYSSTREQVDEVSQAIRRRAADGVEELGPAQEVAALLDRDGGRREHFGFVDGISNPAIEGVRRGGGIGNPDGAQRFRPVSAGEFVLGYPDEGHETGAMPVPHLLARNGTFLVVRKLHQHVARFRDYVARQTALLGPAVPGTHPDFVAAKMVGRWRNGSPLTLYPSHPEPGHDQNHFGYADDPAGARCPLGAHIRRAFPRDALGFDAIVARRRLIRRGIAYGEPLGEDAKADDGKPRGLMFLAYNASIERQFEFVQQQWINGGDEFDQGNDVDPLAASPHRPGRLMIPGDPREGRRPYLCHGIPDFITTRGGEYFFVPSPTALRLMAAGRVVVA